MWIIVMFDLPTDTNAARKEYTRFRKSLIEEGNIDAYFKMYALQCSLMCFAVSMTFMNRFRAEILGWLILFVAASYNVYFLKRNTIDKKGLMSK